MKVWGQYWNGTTYLPVTNWEDLNDVISVTAGMGHDAVLLANGRVQTRGVGPSQTNIPTDLGDLVSLKAYWGRTLGLTSDSKVAGWGNLSSVERAQLSALSNVVDVAPGGFHSIVLLGVSNATPPSFVLNPARGSNGFQFSFPTEIGRTYVIERSPTLNESAWIFRGLILGDGTRRTFLDPSVAAEAYFRVRKNPRN